MAMALEVIQPHRTWDILDASKLTCYMECPRKFFFRYILGWAPDYPNNHLVFGSAWHTAMEHLLRESYSPDSLLEAKHLFMAYYRQHFGADTDEIYVPKHPANALNALDAYFQKYKHEMHTYKVLFTEIAGLVMVGDNTTMTFKMDAVLQDLEHDKIIGLDHKTSQRKMSNWGDHWTLSGQMLLYLHTLYCLYGENAPVEMLVRCGFFYKAQPNNFEEHPIDKSLEQMEAWLARTTRWIEALDKDKAMLANEDDTDQVSMASFPQNDTACFNYGQQCTYFDFCNTWSNPLMRCERQPIGYKVEFWDPMALPEIRTKVDLTQPLMEGTENGTTQRQ